VNRLARAAPAAGDMAQGTDLRARVLVAIRWSLLSKLGGQLASWAVTLYVIRLLTPDDYGAMAMAGVPFAFCYLLNTAGLDAALVQSKELSARVRAQIFGAVIVLNLVLFLGFVVAAPWIAAFYRDPRLTAIITVLAFQFVFLIFETLPQAQLERDLRFGPRSIVELVTQVAGSLVTLVLAWTGFGVWTLVWGSLVTIAIRMLGLNLVQPSLCRPAFSFAGMTEAWRFGRAVTADRLIRFAFADTDRLIGGKVFGGAALGYYAVASDIAALPIHKLTGLINSIALPAFSRAPTHRASPGASLVAVCRLMSLLAFPFFFGLASVATEIIALFLGPAWQAMALPLQLLSLVMPLRMLMNTFQPFLWGIGLPGGSVSTFLIGGLSMPVGFLVGAHWGPVGLSVAWLVVYPCVFLFSVVHVSALVGTRATDLLRPLRDPACACLLMCATVLAARSFLGGGRDVDTIRLVELVLVGAAAYIGCMFLLDQALVREAAALLRAFLPRRPRLDTGRGASGRPRAPDRVEVADAVLGSPTDRRVHARGAQREDAMT
jgi:teichuronic acid exporter